MRSGSAVAADLGPIDLDELMTLADLQARVDRKYPRATFNRRWVFRHRVPPSSPWSPPVRYAALALVVLALTVVLLEALDVVVGSVVAAKAVTELTLFAASFVAQRSVVFGLGRIAPTPTAEPVRETQATGSRAGVTL